MLDDYNGTLLLVSHDREFLDRIVTSTIAIEGNGIITEYAGGYSDYLYQRKDENLPFSSLGSRKRKKTQKKNKLKNNKAKKLSYKDQRELENLPQIISSLQKSKQQLESILADPNLYTQDALTYNDVAEKLKKLNTEIMEAEDRWLFLETTLESLSK
jgi:ATP-binding cassette subfamily F protein uup